jgi:hypothetical protein
MTPDELVELPDFEAPLLEPPFEELPEIELRSDDELPVEPLEPVPTVDADDEDVRVPVVPVVMIPSTGQPATQSEATSAATATGNVGYRSGRIGGSGITRSSGRQGAVEETLAESFGIVEQRPAMGQPGGVPGLQLRQRCSSLRGSADCKRSKSCPG